jgi:hypothetical protein
MAEKKIDSSVLFKEQIAKLLRSADEFTRENASFGWIRRIITPAPSSNVFGTSKNALTSAVVLRHMKQSYRLKNE